MVLYFVAIVPSAIFHEYMHGWAAEQLGDPTARYAGRLTLDPRAHIDWFGTILIPIMLFFISGGGFLFAYAKPVPYNPYNLKNQKWGPVVVGLAGPLANFALAVVFALVSKFTPVDSPMFAFYQIIIIANLSLMVFNLVPLPPLDGSKLLYALWPASAANALAALERYSFVILIIFIFYGAKYLSPIIAWLYALIT